MKFEGDVKVVIGLPGGKKVQVTNIINDIAYSVEGVGYNKYRLEQLVDYVVNKLIVDEQEYCVQETVYDTRTNAVIYYAES